MQRVCSVPVYSCTRHIRESVGSAHYGSNHSDSSKYESRRSSERQEKNEEEATRKERANRQMNRKEESARASRAVHTHTVSTTGGQLHTLLLHCTVEEHNE